MFVGLMLKSVLVIVAIILIAQWLTMVFKIDKSLYLFGINVQGPSGHNIVLGNFGGIVLGIAVMTLLFVFQSALWMYPLMLLALTVLLGRLISFAQLGLSSIGVIGSALEVLGIAILSLFASNLVTY